MGNVGGARPAHLRAPVQLSGSRFAWVGWLAGNFLSSDLKHFAVGLETFASGKIFMYFALESEALDQALLSNPVPRLNSYRVYFFQECFLT